MKCGKPYCACVGQCFAESSPLDDGQLMTTNTTQQALDAALAECERLNDTLDKLVQWSDAYPIAVFPEPDFTKAHKVLRENGMTLDAISASNMRHVIKGVREIIDAVRGKP